MQQSYDWLSATAYSTLSPTLPATLGTAMQYSASTGVGTGDDLALTAVLGFDALYSMPSEAAYSSAVDAVQGTSGVVGYHSQSSSISSSHSVAPESSAGWHAYAQRSAEWACTNSRRGSVVEAVRIEAVAVKRKCGNAESLRPD